MSARRPFRIYYYVPGDQGAPDTYAIWLEERCRTCNGALVGCRACAETGYVLTPAGQALAGFVQAYVDGVES